MGSPTSLEPPEEWARLRQGCPVAHVRLPSGDKAVLLTRYDDVKQLMSDPRFSHQLDAADAARISANESGGVFSKKRESTLSSKEGHQRWRRLVSKSFTTNRMLALQPRIEQMAEQLVDAMQRQGNRAELVSSLGFPLPVMVICASCWVFPRATETSSPTGPTPCST